MTLDYFLKQANSDPARLATEQVQCENWKFDELTNCYYEMSYFLDDWESYSVEERAKIKAAFLKLVENINKWNPKWISENEDFLKPLEEVE